MLAATKKLVNWGVGYLRGLSWPKDAVWKVPEVACRLGGRMSLQNRRQACPRGRASFPSDGPLWALGELCGSLLFGSLGKTRGPFSGKGERGKTGLKTLQ